MAKFIRYRNRSPYGYTPGTVYVEVPRRDREGLIVDYDVRELTATAIWRRAKRRLVTAEHRAKRWCKVWDTFLEPRPGDGLEVFVRKSRLKFTRATGGSLTSPKYEEFKNEYHIRCIDWAMAHGGVRPDSAEKLQILADLGHEYDIY